MQLKSDSHSKNDLNLDKLSLKKTNQKLKHLSIRLECQYYAGSNPRQVFIHTPSYTNVLLLLNGSFYSDLIVDVWTSIIWPASTQLKS